MECGILVKLKDGTHKLIMSDKEQYNYLFSRNSIKKLNFEQQEELKYEIMSEVQKYYNDWATITII